ncbi:MAG TPA: flagellar type III secretion system pore protein FliP [Candidatus Kapabacteria bacterium]|jgi:flagellar biosynthetic protein FliP|nr:flagellar type III secretion system pore protein FliP [Candidatus Kapabacteria bacterium]
MFRYAAAGMNQEYKQLLKKILLFLFIFISTSVLANDVFAQTAVQPLPLPKLSVNVEEAKSSKDLVLNLQILMVMTVLTLAPSILIMMTCFTRIIVVFHFTKQALGTQTQPPAQLLTGLALFLTFFVMQPVLDQSNREGLQPYMRDEITQEQAITSMVKPFRTFMLKHTREEDLGLFIKFSGADKPKNIDEVSTITIIPAYAISELRIAFQIGFIIFIPFLVIDMIVSSILMSLGMMLLPPQLISLPLKVLLFILIDGWHLLISSLMDSIMRGG